MKRNEIHITHNSDRGGWDVKRTDASRASGHFETKNAAYNAGRQMAINHHAELVIHGLNGKIQNANSYGHDPCPPVDEV